MSWTKRPGDGSAPAPEPYAPQQPFGNQQSMYPNYQGGAPSSTQQQQHYWQMQQQQQQPQPPAHYQQYNQGYQHQEYNNANQFFQSPAQQPPAQYNQNYPPNSTFNITQPGYQQPNYYQNQPPQQQQNYSQNKNGDGWEDNWDWGWDEAKQAQNAAQANTSSTSQTQQVPPQQVFNNANVIEESFASTDTWNWSLEDKKGAEHTQPLQQSQQQAVEPAALPSDSLPLEKTSAGGLSPQSIQPPVEEVKTLNDREVVKERLPNLALGKRFHLDNLTPQWSIESQMSQESSDGPHTHSESTYRSENQSRNSSKSSPGFNTDNTNFNYSQPGFDETYTQNDWSRQSGDDLTVAENEQSNSRFEIHDNISESLQEMSISNCENPVADTKQSNIEFSANNVHDNKAASSHPPTSVAPPLSNVAPSHPPPTRLPPPATNTLPPPPVSLPPPPPPTSTPPISAPLPTSSAPNSIPPPTNFPPTTSTNPFKLGGAFSHKSATKPPTSSSSVNPSFSSSLANPNLASPSVVSKISQQNRMPDGFGANLETTPDNSERPDQPQVPTFRSAPIAQSVPDNLEIAPQNDRNEYLQTAHLSSSDYGENTDFSQISHSGLHRMVVGQQENEYSQNINISGDEPPPGLSRMVPGQQTESDGYNQPNDNYLDRHIDGQPTDNSERPFRQGDGQQMSDNYAQPPNNRSTDRRPIGLDRMVPGEPSNSEYPQYQSSTYSGANEHRVIPGVDNDYPISTDTGPSSVREQNVDGSDYTDRTSRNASRNVIGARESSNDISPDFSLGHDDQQREVTMEGENLQDLSAVSPADMTYSRGQVLEGADENLNDIGGDRKTDLSDSMDHPITSSRRQSLNRVTSGEDSERDRAFKSSPRRDKDKHRSTRDRDRDRDRYRDDRKYDRDHPDRRSGRHDRRSEKERRDRKERDSSPERRHRHRARYETEDTDYYSDKEKERRRYREGSYASKPPRPDDKDRRYDDRSRRYNTIERDRRYEDEWDSASRSRRGERPREKYERRYRDIDPTRTYQNMRRDDDERRRGEALTAESRGATDDELSATRRSTRRRHRPDTYYDVAAYGAGYGDPYALQRQQYEYYEHLRHTNPAAYMELYKQLMEGHAPDLKLGAPYSGFSSLAYGAGTGPGTGRGSGGSVHSGRSSANLHKLNDTWGGSLRDAPSLRTDLSDRDLNTDASLNLQLEESTVRSERLTPFKFSTAHVKASISSGDVVVVRGAYPCDGRPPAVQLLSLRAALQTDPDVRLLAQCPSPFVKGVSHKKSVLEYCLARVREASEEGDADVAGYALLWRLLALLLKQNGVVVGSDLAELLMQSEQADLQSQAAPAGLSADPEQEAPVEDESLPNIADLTLQEEPLSSKQRAALEKFRELMTLGNQQEALETAIAGGLWGHALYVSWFSGRRVRAATLQRFRGSLPPTDPLHTLYCALNATQPPAATCVADARWGSWMSHAAILLANGSARPEEDRKALIQMGDSLLSRGLLYSAQFCYIAGGETLSQHPAAPLPRDATTATPRLALLLADARVSSLRQLAATRAILATEVYEYALSLNQDYVLPELQVYKLLLASRLADGGLYERALAYTESIARAAQRRPDLYSARLLAATAALADRLKYHDPVLTEDPPLEEGAESSEGSPRHQLWLEQLSTLVAQRQESAQTTPQHNTYSHYPQETYDWKQQQIPQPQPIYEASVVEAAVQPPAPPAAEDSAEFPQYYQPSPPTDSQPSADSQYNSYTSSEWRPEEPQHQTYADNYYGGYGGYGESVPGANGESGPRPLITMPGHSSMYSHDDDRPPSVQQTDRETDTPKPKKQDSRSKDEGKSEGGRGKGSGGSWFGGILTKLSLRPPNQMILPEDTNPSIVWDEDQKRWRNVDGDSEPAPPPPPPPRSVPAAAPPAGPPGAAAPSPLLDNSQVSSPASPPPVSNIFKMQRGRHIKKSYVDVLNPGGGAGGAPPPADVLGPLVTQPPPNNFFVPQGGLYNPSQPMNLEDDQYHTGI